MNTSLYAGISHRRVTVLDIAAAKERGEKWAMLTSYDQMTAEIFEEAGIPALLVGDSAANTVLGYQNTIGVTVDEFHAVKLEGGTRVLPQIEMLVTHGIPVIGHLGLTPQSVHTLGGYRVQGRGGKGEEIIRDAKAIESAGAFALVLELIPSDLATRITSSISIPTIGIGAGKSCDAQVLVWQDLLGLTAKSPKLAKRYLELRSLIGTAVTEWANDVSSGEFPGADQSFE
ncbi:MAG: 3-methyl-2-oxobutanoate hydroxymethyltransferase [Actinobacteria bacterium]|nr:3-methyl-2-oxobutanoate hydroxymethyltransferase [Actinomycetota bacterium]